MARNANDLFTDALWRLKTAGKIQDSRNGKVLSIPYPTLWTMNRPNERVLFSPKRKANPYFHIMETVWMFAGEKGGEWLTQFNSNMKSYMEPTGKINGAYGHRWRTHFNHDQIVWAINELKNTPDSRQAVIAMYDPAVDHDKTWKDRPCNTHIYFRIVDGRLDMTVCNRSNDVVWGMCGANIVHMTCLQELVASAVRVPLGGYFLMTNNLHIYEPHWSLLEHPDTYDLYATEPVCDPTPLITGDCDWHTFLYECRQFIMDDQERTYSNKWLEHTVKPMFSHYMSRLNGDKHSYDTKEVQADDWRVACDLWRTWNDN